MRQGCGGSFINQFNTAYKKANEICDFIFNSSSKITVVVEYFGESSPIDCLGIARELKELEVWPKAQKQHWFTPDDDSEEISGQHCIGYEVTANCIQNILWSNIASDLGVKPSANCRIHIFDFQQKLHVFPYDDRGMDIVGPNHELLEKLYFKFKKYLLQYDIDTMKNDFE